MLRRSTQSGKMAMTGDRCCAAIGRGDARPLRAPGAQPGGGAAGGHRTGGAAEPADQRLRRNEPRGIGDGRRKCCSMASRPPAGAAGRCAGDGEGSGGHRRVSDAAGKPADRSRPGGRRRTTGGGAESGGGGDPGQDLHDRVRLEIAGRLPADRDHAQSVEHRVQHGRLVVGRRRSGGGRVRAVARRDGCRRLDPDSGRLVRAGRAEAELRARAAMAGRRVRHRCVRRPDDAHGARRRADAVGDGAV